MNRDLLKEMRDQTMWLTINRVERRNAINANVVQGLRQALDEANNDNSVRAVVSTGAGESAFCSGADLPEVKIGVFPAQVLAVPQHQLPRRLLIEMCITDEPISAEQALGYGLVNHLVDAGVDDALDVRLSWLFSLLQDKSPSAIRRGLYTLTEDFQEGVTSFIEKRKPKRTGR